MNHNIKTFFGAILAGICIGIGCQIYLSCDNKYIGASLFSVGLISILVFGFGLYTGKVGYIAVNKPKYVLEVLVALIGNIIGCVIFGTMFQTNLAIELCANKLTTPMPNLLFKSIMCGVLMFIAVDSYRRTNNFLLTFLCIPTFILSGYEHSIADTVYFAMGDAITLQTLQFLLVAIFGNAIGGMLIPFTNKILNNTKLL